MEENKLFKEIKSAAENAETKDFPGIEKVWKRVEEKLENKENKKAIWRWKKIAVAASLLLITTLGYQFFKNNQTKIESNQTVTTNDSIKKKAPTTDAMVISETVNPEIKKDAEQILQKQLSHAAQVVLEEDQKALNAYKYDSIASVKSGRSSYSGAKVQNKDVLGYSTESVTEKAKDGNVEMFMNKSNQVSNLHKEEPLVVIDKKVEKKSIKDIEFDDVDSLVVLKEPLYIINGVEYTEEEVFGPNPTSPYTPLNKQEIEMLSILQDEKAVEIYGEKGNKGVVIITTKNGKPVTASKKAK